MYSKKERPIKILQFGEGNFLRAFVDNFIQELNNQNLINSDVAVVQPLEFGRIDAMKEQDGLYTLFLEGIKNNEVVKSKQIIDVIGDLIDPYKELEKYLSYARSEELEMVFSNTTEAGITYEAEKVSKEATPVSFPGKLLLFLRERYLFFKGSNESGLEIIPCELIDDNGTELKATLIKLARYNEFEPEFIYWLENNNRYYNTLVDRIVPGYPRDDAESLEKELGYMDHSMVKGEIFHLWVIEGPEALHSKLPFEQSGLDVYYVESIKPYKQRKVKILNGSHTALVPVAYLSGLEAVKESIDTPIFNQFVKQFIFDEVIPTINLPKDDMDKFASSIIERYSNPFIHHLLISIALNSISKYKTRILPTVLDLHAQGGFAKHALFSLAALIVFYRGIDEDNRPIPLKDDERFLTLFAKLWEQSDVKQLVLEVLSMNHWETDYLKTPMVVDFVTNCVIKITEVGMEEALKIFLKGE